MYLLVGIPSRHDLQSNGRTIYIQEILVGEFSSSCFHFGSPSRKGSLAECGKCAQNFKSIKLLNLFGRLSFRGTMNTSKSEHLFQIKWWKSSGLACCSWATVFHLSSRMCSIKQIIWRTTATTKFPLMHHHVILSRSTMFGIIIVFLVYDSAEICLDFSLDRQRYCS